MYKHHDVNATLLWRLIIVMTYAPDAMYPLGKIQAKQQR